MGKPIKKKSVKGYDVDRELAAVDALFKKLASDKSLPTFGQHFMNCLISGVSEHVNLKAMYPKTHKQLSVWLDGHNRKIRAVRGK